MHRKEYADIQVTLWKLESSWVERWPKRGFYEFCELTPFKRYFMFNVSYLGTHLSFLILKWVCNSAMLL